jgi:hypothetical protein
MYPILMPFRLWHCSIRFTQTQTCFAFWFANHHLVCSRVISSALLEQPLLGHDGSVLISSIFNYVYHCLSILLPPCCRPLSPTESGSAGKYREGVVSPFFRFRFVSLFFVSLPQLLVVPDHRCIWRRSGLKVVVGELDVVHRLVRHVPVPLIF